VYFYLEKFNYKYFVFVFGQTKQSSIYHFKSANLFIIRLFIEKKNTQKDEIFIEQGMDIITFQYSKDILYK